MLEVGNGFFVMIVSMSLVWSAKEGRSLDDLISVTLAFELPLMPDPIGIMLSFELPLMLDPKLLPHRAHPIISLLGSQLLPPRLVPKSIQNCTLKHTTCTKQPKITI